MSGITNGTGSGGGGSTIPEATLIRSYVPGVFVHDAVYQTIAGSVDRASAVSIATTPVLGVVTQLDVPIVGQCYVQYDGDVMGFSGLAPGEVYMLSKSPGALLREQDTGNVNYPNTTGNVVQAVGIAMSPSTMQIAIQDQEEL